MLTGAVVIVGSSRGGESECHCIDLGESVGTHFQKYARYYTDKGDAVLVGY